MKANNANYRYFIAILSIAVSLAPLIAQAAAAQICKKEVGYIPGPVDIETYQPRTSKDLGIYWTIEEYCMVLQGDDYGGSIRIIGRNKTATTQEILLGYDGFLQPNDKIIEVITKRDYFLLTSDSDLTYKPLKIVVKATQGHYEDFGIIYGLDYEGDFSGEIQLLLCLNDGELTRISLGTANLSCARVATIIRHQGLTLRERPSIHAKEITKLGYGDRVFLTGRYEYEDLPRPPGWEKMFCYYRFVEVHAGDYLGWVAYSSPYDDDKPFLSVGGLEEYE